MAPDKTHRGNASQFFVAGELCRRGYAAVVTLGNTPNTDILCSNLAGTRFVHVQVKTFVPGKSRKTCSVGEKAERDFGPSFFWIIAGIPEPGSPAPFEYFIVPSSEMARRVAACHAQWLATPGKDGRPHQNSKIRAVAVAGESRYLWSVEPYRDRWDLIENQLSEDRRLAHHLADDHVTRARGEPDHGTE